MEKTEFERRIRRARARVADAVHALEPIERAEAVANGDIAQAAAIDIKATLRDASARLGRLDGSSE